MANSYVHVEPVFARVHDTPEGTGVLEMCMAAENVSGRDTVAGAQRIRGLWRVYPKTSEARTTLLINGVELAGRALNLCDKNPFAYPEMSNNKPTTRLYIQDVPISVADDDIVTAIEKLGVKLLSPLKMERARNKDGKLTRFLTGRRFGLIELPAKPLEREVQLGLFRMTLFYKEMKQQQKCGNCLQTGHMAKFCTNATVCRACKQSGHKANEGLCPSVSVIVESATQQQQHVAATSCGTDGYNQHVQHGDAGGADMGQCDTEPDRRVQRGRQLLERKQGLQSQQNKISTYLRRARSETPSKRQRSESSSPPQEKSKKGKGGPSGQEDQSGLLQEGSADLPAERATITYNTTESAPLTSSGQNQT